MCFGFTVMPGYIGDRNIPNKIKSSLGYQIALNIKPELDVCFCNFLTVCGNKYFFHNHLLLSFSQKFHSMLQVLGNPCVLFRLSTHPGSPALQSFFILFCPTYHSFLSSLAFPSLFCSSQRGIPYPLAGGFLSLQVPELLQHQINTCMLH